MNVLATYGVGKDKILVYETDSLFGEKGSFRVLQFADEAVQGAIDLVRPERIVFEYPRALIHMMEHNQKDLNEFENIFIIGHGIGTISSYFSDKKCVTAEINVDVVQASKQFFGSSGHGVILGDGRQLLEQQHELYDYIVVDAFTSSGVPKHLANQSFFALAHAKLKPDGVLLMNVIGKGKQDTNINASYSTLQLHFPYYYAFTLQTSSDRDIRNSILIGSRKSLRFRLRQMAGFIPYIPEPGYVRYD